MNKPGLHLPPAHFQVDQIGARGMGTLAALISLQMTAAPALAKAQAYPDVRKARASFP